MKKFLALLCCIFLFAITGCNKNDTDNTNSDATSSEEQNSTTSSEIDYSKLPWGDIDPIVLPDDPIE